MAEISKQWQEYQRRAARERAQVKFTAALQAYPYNRMPFWFLHKEISVIPPEGMTEHQRELDRLIREVCNG